MRREIADRQQFQHLEKKRLYRSITSNKRRILLKLLLMFLNGVILFPKYLELYEALDYKKGATYTFNFSRTFKILFDFSFSKAV